MQPGGQIVIEQVQSVGLTSKRTHFVQEDIARQALGRNTIDIGEGKAIYCAVVQRSAHRSDRRQSRPAIQPIHKESASDPAQAKLAWNSPPRDPTSPDRDLLLQLDIEPFLDSATNQVNQA